MMAPTLTLHLLSLVLFFFTNGQGIDARNLKTELQDQKQFDWNGDVTSTKVHGTSQPNNPDQLFVWSDHKDRQSKDVNQLFVWGGHEDKQSKDFNQLLVWSDHKDKQSKDPNQLFVWGVHEGNSKDLVDKQPNDPSQLFVWGGHQNKQPKDPNQLFVWGVHETNSKDLKDRQSKDPSQLLVWGGHQNKQPKDPNQLLVWGDHQDKQPNDPNQLFVWAGHQDKQPKDPNQLFVWGVHETNSKDLKDKQPSDPNQLLVWGGHEDKQPNDPNQLFVWGGHQNKQPKDPNQLLVWGNREANSKDLEDHPSSNLDHTEAFKIGFFGLDDLHVGNVMTLQFPVQKVPHFLSKKEADSIPFSLSQLVSVLHHLSIPEDSPQAKSMQKTLEHCEAVTVTGETRMCVNSVESMLEFVDTIIGSEAKHDILTTSKPSPSAIPLQKYTILEVSHDINTSKWVSCHRMPYPYAVFGCHHIATGSKVFKVSLVGDNNGDKMEALGMCHLDTSDWNPDHNLFKTLGIKPGKNSPACHFFPVNHLLWVPLQPSKSTM